MRVFLSVMDLWCILVMVFLFSLSTHFLNFTFTVLLKLQPILCEHQHIETSATMAQHVDMEGTSTSGEAQEFERILREKGVSGDTIQKLAANGLKTMLRDVHCHAISRRSVYGIQSGYGMMA